MTETKDKRDAFPEIMDMQTAMQYLSEVYNFPCRSRKSFYKLMKRFHIPEVNLNPGGVKKTRRFHKADLDEFAKDPQHFVRKEKNDGEQDE